MEMFTIFGLFFSLKSYVVIVSTMMTATATVSTIKSSAQAEKIKILHINVLCVGKIYDKLSEKAEAKPKNRT